jgi:hypothetical protein
MTHVGDPGNDAETGTFHEVGKDSSTIASIAAVVGVAQRIKGGESLASEWLRPCAMA